MDLALSADQEALRDSVARFVTDVIGIESIVARTEDPVGFDPQLWSQMAELGWLSLAIGAEHDGIDASRGDIAVVFEELGRGPVAGPLFASGVLVPDVLRSFGPSALADELLPAIAAGVARVSAGGDLVGRSPAAGPVPQLTAGGQRRLRGVVEHVREGAGATHHLVVADAEGIPALVLVDAAAPGVHLAASTGAFPRIGRLHLDDVVVAPHHVVELTDGRAPAMERAVLASTPVSCAYQVGSCRSVYEMTLRYSRERVQFGKPIGTFQRVQDHVIDVVNALDAARWTTLHAVWACEQGLDDPAPVHVAKIATAEAHYAACTSAHEVHAGIGSDVQYGLAVHTYASRLLFAYLGDPAWHRRRLADTMGLAS